MPTPTNKKQNESQNIPKIGLIRKLSQSAQDNIDSLYKNIFYTDPINKKSLESIKNDITTSIKNIMSVSSDTTGEPNISKLFERLLLTQNNKEVTSDYDRLFSDNDFISNLTAAYLDNRWVLTIDTEIDEVCRYMPKLQEALDTIADNVLSADSFHKDYLNLTNDLVNTKTSDEQFARNIEDLKKKYDLVALTKRIYKDESKYGDKLIYRVPYDKALQRFLDRRNMMQTYMAKTNENGIIIESSVGDTDTIKMDNITSYMDESGISCNIEICDGFISSIIEQEMKVREKLSKLNEQSIFNESLNEINITSRPHALDNTMQASPGNIGDKLPKHRRFDQTIGDNLELPDVLDDERTNDGLYDTSLNYNRTIKPMNGCIVKELERDRVVPININDICLGYYYFEFDKNLELFDERLSSTGLVNTLTGIRSNHRSEAFDALQRREELLKNIAAELAKRIDVKFIDANQDLKKEIYYILKYNDDFNSSTGCTNNIRVSYIPPEDIKHFYFELDPDTGRGISDLHLSLIPAKLWVAIYLTNCLAIMTRGNDKRVYYVRQNVETNVAKTMLKTIDAIKRSNFGIRQIENINSVLNITGRFNDYIIPRSADGQAPIEMEIMQGQQVEIKTELLNILEESAINPIGVPIEIIQNRQSPDYAMQLTMSNSKFLRFVYDRQAIFQRQMSELITDIYDLEYNTNDKIVLQLPPPLFINVTNTNQLVTNTVEYCTNLTNIVMADEQNDTLKQKVTKELALNFLGSYINIDLINSIVDKAKQTVTRDNISQDTDNAGDENID